MAPFIPNSFGMAGAYVYILLCANDSYYVGSTRSLLKRFKEHQMGKGLTIPLNICR